MFARLGDVALFLAGVLMVAAGVFLLNSGTGQAVLFLLGTGLMVMGALLPRISGTIRISPGSLEMTVIQQLEATRREAEQHLPDQVEEAIGLAFQRLVDSGALTSPDMPDWMTEPEGSPLPRSGTGRMLVALAVALGALVLLAVAAVAIFTALDSPPPGAVPTPTPVAPPNGENPSDPADRILPLATVALAVAVVGGAILIVRRMRRRNAVSDRAEAEPPEVFARRIINELERDL